MKPIIKFLVRLYPSAWRKRYGAELDALLEDATPSVRDAFDVLWGALKMQMTMWDFGRVTFACSVAGVLVAVAASFVIPVDYQSQVTLILTPSDASTPAGGSAQYLTNSFAKCLESEVSDRDHSGAQSVPRPTQPDAPRRGNREDEKEHHRRTAAGCVVSESRCV
jgi:hypothetical protein